MDKLLFPCSLQLVQESSCNLFSTYYMLPQLSYTTYALEHNTIVKEIQLVSSFEKRGKWHMRKLGGDTFSFWLCWIWSWAFSCTVFICVIHHTPVTPHYTQIAVKQPYPDSTSGPQTATRQICSWDQACAKPDGWEKRVYNQVFWLQNKLYEALKLELSLHLQEELSWADWARCSWPGLQTGTPRLCRANPLAL